VRASASSMEESAAARSSRNDEATAL
jgi:hypothetical protein